MKRLAIAAGAVLVLLIAVSSVWHTVRMELLFRTGGATSANASAYGDYAMFPAAEAIHLLGLVVVEVVLVEGVGPEAQLVTLVAGPWRATTEVADTRIDYTYITGASPKGSQLSWSSDESRPAVFVVGDIGQTKAQATVFGREFIVRTNAVVEDHPWSVTLERFGRAGSRTASP